MFVSRIMASAFAFLAVVASSVMLMGAVSSPAELPGAVPTGIAEAPESAFIPGEEEPLPVACEGVNYGKGWCPKLTCATLDCAGNWYSFANANCLATCVGPTFNCCGWAVDTSDDCACVTGGNKEPTGYNCGPCGKVLCSPWPSACQ